MTLAAGTKLDRYEIRSKIGAGGMGEVYLAEDTQLGRRVAIKLLPPETTSDEHARKRLVREARASATLDHPHICSVYEVGEEGGRSFIAMQYIEGETLDLRLKRKPLELKETLTLASQIADALTEAHTHGIIHRDIKPSNIMITSRGQAKVMDFGLAKIIEQAQVVKSEAETEAVLSTPGAIIGTALYMSPEQVRALQMDARTDIWSLGVVLYEMVAGCLPFEGSTMSEILASILNEKEPPPLARFAREVPAELERIVEKALRKDREERYQTIKDMLLDLRSLKHRLEFEAELERSRPPEASSDAAVTSNSDQMTAAVGPATLGGEAAQTVPNNESFVGRIKRHKRSVMIGLTVLALAAAVTLFWYFKNSRTAPILTDKDTILLADFDNKTGDEVFDGALKQGLAVQLGQSPFLSIFPESSVRQTLKLMNRSPDERVTGEVARELCERQGLKAFITGSIAPLGSHYVLTLEAINGHSGEVLEREQTEAESKEQVLKALSQAASRLREKLGESLSSIEKFNAPLQQATTSSLEALRAYSLGIEGINKKGKYLEAIPFFKRAVELDPNFAAAYARLSLAYYNSGQPGLAVGCAQKAFELRERVSERERFYIESRYYSDATGEINKAIETYELWRQTYPRDQLPLTNVSARYLEIGQYEKAIENARESIRRNPAIAAANSNLGEALIRLNRFAEARDVLERALQKFEITDIHAYLYQIAFVQGDVAAMKQRLDWAKGRPDEHVAFDWQADTTAFAGHWKRAEDFSHRSIDLATRSDAKEVAVGYAAGAALRGVAFGQCAQAKASAAQSLALNQSDFLPTRAVLGLALCGEAARAQQLVEEHAKRYPKATLLNGLWLPTIRAAIELQRGNAAQAIELLQSASRYEAAAKFWPQYLRGQAYLKLSRGAEAAAEFQKILDHRGEAPLSALYPLAHLGLARAAALAGDMAKSRKAYQDFFALWKDSDTDIPILTEAKKEYEKLK